MTKTIIRCTTILILAFGITSLIKGMASEDLQVLVNDSAVINCFSKEVKSVQWHHTPPGKSSSEYLYAGGRFYGSYKDRPFSVQTNLDANNYALVITNVTYEDAGFYECKDDVLSGVFGSTQLIVLNSIPVCNTNMHPDGFIGPNKCDLQKENMAFSCSVSFRGKISPSLMWRSSNDSQSLINSVCTTQSNHINCSFTLEADPKYDGTVFMCETKESIGVRFNCSTEVVKVQHFSVEYENSTRKVHDNASCIVTSNLETRYNWTIEQNGQNVFLSSKRTIVMDKPGIYRCYVEYSIRNNTCYFPASVVNASEATVSIESQKDPGTNAVAIAVPIVIILIAIIVSLVAYIIIRKRKKTNSPEEAILLENKAQTDSALPRDDDIKFKIEAQREKLVDIVESEFELLPALVGNGTLTSKEMDEIEAEPTNAQKNTKLLDCISRNAKHREFLAGLRNDGQQHVANLIEANGIYATKYDLQWPLSEKEVEYINKNYEHLGEVLSTERDFVEMLLENEAISNRQKKFIIAKTNKFERNKAFLDILRRFSLKAHFLVTKCLRASKQELIARILEDGGDDIKSKIEAQREKLVDIVESEFELLPELLSNGTLTANEMDGVKAEPTNARKNTVLLRCILRNGKHREFLAGLRNDGQQHVANLIEANGIYEPEYDLQWPLSGKEVENINRNYKQLCEMVSTESVFVDILLASDAISNRQKDFIIAKTNKFERNKAFLDILRRFSLKTYFLITRCLRESKQELNARILEDGGAIVPLHANLVGQNTKEIENKLVELLKADLQKAKTTKINGYFVVDARQENSIVLFTCCLKSEEFSQLCNEVADGHIRDIVGQLFNRLLQDSQSETNVQSVTINDEDKDSIKRSFELEETRDKKFDTEIAKLRSKLQNDIKYKIEAQREKLVDIVESEFELLPELLGYGDLTANEMDEVKAEQTNARKNTMLLVCISRNAKYREFLEALRRSGQIHVVNWIEANGIYDEHEYGLQWPLSGKEVENINRHFKHLGEVLSTERDFVDMLLASEAIKKSQKDFIDAKTNKFERNEAFLDILRRFSLKAYFLVTHCLRASKQELIADILEDGGGEGARDKEFDAQIRKLRSKLQNESVIKKPPSKSDSNGQSPDTPAEDTSTTTPEKKDKKENVTEITESNWAKILQSNYADLLVKIDNSSEGGLAGEFKKSNLFTPLQIKNIWGHGSSIERNKALLSLLERGGLKRFMAVRSALEKSGQEELVGMHLSLIKEHLTKPDDKYKEPLKGSYRYQLLVNWNELLTTITHEDELIIRINERGTLTNYQIAVLRDLPTSTSKVNYLLRLLETGSQQHFDDFCDCLVETQQGHIVNDYLTPKSINKNLDDIPTSFKDMPLRFSIKTKPIRGQVLVISNRSYLDQNRSEMHGNERNLNIFFEEKLVFQKKPIFDQKLVTNETALDLMKTLKTEQQNPKDYDVFIMFLFSYGNSKEIFTTDGQSFKIDDIFDIFDDENCPKLKGKPKLFIIQTFERDGALDSPSLDAEGKLAVSFNLKADMAVVYATVKGEPKDGRELTGTMFTTCLLEVFFSEIEADFGEIIEKVVELLSKREQKITLPNGDVQTVQQLATFQTTLTEKVFLVEQKESLMTVDNASG